MYYAGDGVDSGRFSGNIKEPVSLAEHEVATRTWGQKCEQRRRMGDTRVKVEKTKE